MRDPICPLPRNRGWHLTDIRLGPSASLPTQPSAPSGQLTESRAHLVHLPNPETASDFRLHNHMLSLAQITCSAQMSTLHAQISSL